MNVRQDCLRYCDLVMNWPRLACVAIKRCFTYERRCDRLEERSGKACSQLSSLLFIDRTSLGMVCSN